MKAARKCSTTSKPVAHEEGWLHVVDADAPQSTHAAIDAGEASAIHLARTWLDSGASVLLVMDDAAGRQEAALAGLPVLGTVGVVLLAREKGLLDSVRAVLEEMVRKGYFIDRKVIETALRQAGEHGQAG